MKNNINGIESSGGVQMPYALDPDTKRIVHISAAQRGKKCALVCPECQKAVEACQGPHVQHYFRHCVDVGCGGGPETALHIRAIEVLGASSYFYVPPVMAVINGKTARLNASEKVCLINTAVRHRGWKPFEVDVVSEVSGRELSIEVFVRHKCSDKKVLQYITDKKEAVEIDLSNIPDRVDIYDDKEFSDFVLCEAGRVWIYNQQSHESTTWDVNAEIEEKTRRAETDYISQQGIAKREKFASWMHKAGVHVGDDTVPLVDKVQDWLPNQDRIGQVRREPGKPFEHYCMSCGAWGAFGFDVNILAGKTGRWYCNEHKPQE